MAIGFYDPKSSEPELRSYEVRFTGAGAGSPTKNLGGGIAFTWISTGLYELTWATNPGPVFCGLSGVAWQATTASDLKGYSLVAGDWNATTLKLRVSVTGATDALVDLTSTQKVSFAARFKEQAI